MADEIAYNYQTASGHPVGTRMIDNGDGTHSPGAAVISKVATIALNQSLSAAVSLGGLGVVQIVMPGAWDAAGITFQVSLDGVTYVDLYNNSGSEYSVVVSAGRAIILPPADLAGFNYIKVRSGTAGTPVPQTAARAITLVGKAL